MEIFTTISGSRLYGTNTPDSDTDYKGVYLPTKEQILLGKRNQVKSTSTGASDSRNGSEDVHKEMFELQYFLKLASDMQTIPVEMLFAPGNAPTHPVWKEVIDNKHKILNNNTKPFVGYCKGQATRYSMRGTRLETYMRVTYLIKALVDQAPKTPIISISHQFDGIEGVKVESKKQPDGTYVPYLDVYGRQCPMTVQAREALKIYLKPVKEAGNRAKMAQQSGGMDSKALYHAVRIAEEGIRLFSTGEIQFPCQNLPLLMNIRSGDMCLDEVLDIFDEKMSVLEDIGDKSPLPDNPDLVWINEFVCEVYEKIVKGS